jgi:hypothetical protein
MQNEKKEQIQAVLADTRGWLEKASDTEVFKELAVKSQASYETLLDHDAIQREEDWNALAHQVVGRELSH